MNTEDTVYDSNKTTTFDESTQMDEKKNETAAKKTEVTAETASKKSGTWKKVAISGGTGILFGAAYSLFTSATPPDPNDPTVPDTTPVHEPETPTPIVDESISTATCVDDDMSFSQAFAAARAEVGPGGVFEWHGNLYNTYTAEEWDNLSAEAREDYNEHFAWAAEESAPLDGTPDVTPENYAIIEDEAIQPVGYDPTEDEVQAYTSDETLGNTDELEVEVLGVEHDAETGANIGYMSVDDQDVYLIDVDNDQVFEAMATDADGDNYIAENEIVDISDEGLTVDDMGGFNDFDPNAGLYASTDEPDYLDYTNNDVYEG